MKEKHEEVIIPEGSVFLDKYGLWVSRDGRIFKIASRGNFGHTKGKPYELSSIAKRNGYLSVSWHCWIDGKYNGHTKAVHRLIAEAFIPNPDNLPTVDHINRNILDNRIENLRWCSWETQENNRKNCDASKEKYGVRQCENRKEYQKRYDRRYYIAHYNERIQSHKAWYKNKRNVGRYVHFCDGSKRFYPYEIADELLKIPKQLRLPPDTESPASARPTGLSI